MEALSPVTPEGFSTIKKIYELNENKSTYTLEIEIDSSEHIIFKIRQKNILVKEYYYVRFDLSQITKKFLLTIDYYDNFEKVLKFCDLAIKNKKLRIIPKNEEKKEKLKIQVKKELDFEEIECIIELDEKILSIEEMLQIIFEEIKIIKKESSDERLSKLEEIIKNIDKSKNNGTIDINNSEIYKNLINEINELKKEKENMKVTINNILQENKEIKEKLNQFEILFNEYKQMFDKIKNENQIKEENKKKEEEEKEKFDKENENVDFHDDPKDLKFYDVLTTQHTGGGRISGICSIYWIHR